MTTPVDWQTDTIPLNWQSNGYKEPVGNRVLRTPVEDGPDKIRLMGTGQTRIIEGRVLLDHTQTNALITFYNANAAQKLRIPNPREQSAKINVRFMAPPAITSSSPDLFNIALSFEVVT